MKNLSRSEIQNKIIKYLNSKNIDIKLENNLMIWRYEPYYSKFNIQLYLYDENNDNNFVIKYYVNSCVKNIRRRKTSVAIGFCLKIYKNLILFKNELDENASYIKIETDTTNKYCSEISMYYNRIHNKVDISTNIQSKNDIVNINVNCRDENKSTYYVITYQDNRYYLNSKVEYLNKFLNMEN